MTSDAGVFCVLRFWLQTPLPLSADATAKADLIPEVEVHVQLSQGLRQGKHLAYNLTQLNTLIFLQPGINSLHGRLTWG